MQAGGLSWRIRLERVSNAFDEFNAPIEIWSEIATVWANKKDVRDAEKIAASGVASSIMTRFRIRWSDTVADVNPKDRVVYNARVYDIFSVKEIGAREGIEITASARND